MRTDELWCNGSTTDSDSVCLGSNPGSSTKVPLLRGAFFCAVGGAGEYLKMRPDVRKCRGGARNFEKVRFFTSKMMEKCGK